MALTGEFKETPFADLIQLYASSNQTVAVTVSLPDGRGDDGVFYVENGNVVDGWLGDAKGREAVRHALRLGSGSFRVDPNVRATERTVTVPWRQLLLEELVSLDEERRPRKAAAAGGSPRTPAAMPLPGSAPSPTPGARPLPRANGAGAAFQGAPAAKPAAPPRASPGGASPLKTPWVIASAAVVLVVLAGAAVYGLRSREAPRAAPAPAAAPAAKAAPAATGPAPLLFGMASPLFGSDKELGRGMKVGVELAFAAANEAGGVHGRKVALVALDDGNDPARTTEAMRELVEKRKVFAVVGNAGTATAGAALPVVSEHKVPFVGALGGGAGLRKDPPDHGVFVFRPGLAEETAAAVRYLVEVRRIEAGDIAFFSEEDDSGQAGWSGAAQQLKSYGREPGQVLRVGYKRNSADVEAAFDRLRKAGARVKAVVMTATHRPAARLIEKLSEVTPGLVYTLASSVDAGLLAEELTAAKVPLAGDALVVTQVVPLPSSRSSAVMRYRALLEKHALGELPGALSMEGWIVGTLVVKALEAAGPDADGERLIAALESLHGLDIGIGVPLGFSKTDHQASHKVWGTTLDPAAGWRQIDLE